MPKEEENERKMRDKVRKEKGKREISPNIFTQTIKQDCYSLKILNLMSCKFENPYFSETLRKPTPAPEVLKMLYIGYVHVCSVKLIKASRL